MHCAFGEMGQLAVNMQREGAFIFYIQFMQIQKYMNINNQSRSMIKYYSSLELSLHLLSSIELSKFSMASVCNII